MKAVTNFILFGLFAMMILFTSCGSRDSKPKIQSIDSCNIAKQFEMISITQASVKPGYTGVLTNYWGDDTTKPDFQHFFENGKLIKSVFYYENGKVQEEYHYKCGALNGIQQYYFDNGKPAKIIPYSYGYREGVGSLYNEKGSLVEQVIFQADSLIETKRFDEQGKLLTH